MGTTVAVCVGDGGRVAVGVDGTVGVTVAVGVDVATALMPPQKPPTTTSVAAARDAGSGLTDGRIDPVAARR